ncbi:hypothetical protein HYH02_006065 [Chlamydomonas schloesseri]|uniref:Uncharacterized protein n=1 Tax=Chlamydomonas schloesseri TaxID=2026947 RepID=A0A835WJ94_9CHLO|nr:hypothetical protein HYH02_006065 [Chlamydomonas schloesseri]|eukprot:KAG2448709.1 hypothetical protein HYH02_006065 [Chlamydomonas schloesseri]
MQALNAQRLANVGQAGCVGSRRPFAAPGRLSPLAPPHLSPVEPSSLAPHPLLSGSSAVSLGATQPSRDVACCASSTSSSSGTQSSSSSGGAAAAAPSDWSKRLLSVAKTKGKNKSGGGGNGASHTPDADIFTPAKPASKPAAKKPVSNLDIPGLSYYEGRPDDDEDDEDLDADMLPGSERKRLPAEMRCFDTARIYIKGGDGGNGCVAFRREKFVEHGGPSGGNGGRGGNVWAVVDPNLNSLSVFRGQVHFRAEGGVNGQGSNCEGADAEDLIVHVPAGTIIRRKDAEEDDPPLAELLKPGERALLAVGGRGGRGNFSFKTSRDRAPTIAEKGEKGEELWVDLELKVVADVGIIGVPNAGKSTLLSVITAAKPKIANYPFTTLVPNLGVCEMDYRTTVFADVPGLLEGAHEGLGLGHEFLRHVQRCRVLVHVVDGTSPDPVGDFNAINLELELFNPDIKDKPQIVAYNKVDIPDSGDFWEMVREQLTAELGVPADKIFPISAATGQGVIELVRAVRGVLDELGPQQLTYETNALNQTAVQRRDVRIDDFTVLLEDLPPGSPSTAPRVFFVEGEGIERFAQMTNWDYYEAVKRFQRVLEVSGINGALKAKGVKEGDSVVIGETEFNWSDEKSDGAVYDSWLKDMKDRGVNRQGSARWPHPDVR